MKRWRITRLQTFVISSVLVLAVFTILVWRVQKRGGACPNSDSTYVCKLVSATNLPTDYLVIIGIEGVLAAIFTLGAINRQAGIAERQTRSVHHQAIQVKRQTRILGKTADAAKESAGAALLNAEALVNSERPWLLLGKKLFPDRAHTWLELEIRVHNFGRTPAKVTAMQFDVRFGDSQENPPRPEFFEKIEPFNPHVLPQGEELTYEIDASHGEGANKYPGKHLWVSGLVKYEDTFGSANPATHETLFCGHMVQRGGRSVWQRGPDKYNKAT